VTPLESKLRNWTTVRLDDFCDTSSGGTPSRDHPAFYENGTIPWVKSGELSQKIVTETGEKITSDALVNSSAKMVKKGAILVAMYGATVGQIAVLGIDAATNQAVCAIEPDQTKCLPRFLYYSLTQKVPELLQMRVGGAQPNISQKLIRDLKFALPTDLREQARIVELLDQADALRRQRAEADAKLARLLPALFHHHFGNPETNPKNYAIGDFDQAFDDVSAGEAKLQTKTFLLSGLLPIIDQGAEQISGYTDDLSAKFTGSTPVVIFGDHTRNFKFVDHDFAIGADGVRVLSAKPGFLPEFLYWHCRLLNIPSAGYSRHMKFLKAKRFIRPPELEQKQFAQAAKNARLLNAQAASSAAKLETLFQTLLHRAFTGELTARWREAHLREGVQELSRLSRA
jgi:type I restriction enzyme, S subunit